MKQIHGYIYCVTNVVTGKQYVGKTTGSIAKRFAGHCKCESKHSLLQKSMRKHGTDKFTVREISRCYSEEGLNAAEIRWITKLNTLVPNGYNLSGGGEGGVWHPRSVRKLANGKKKFWSDPENKARMLERMFDPEVIAKRAEGLRRAQTAERRAAQGRAISERNKDPKRRAEIGARSSAHWARPGAREQVSKTNKQIFSDPAQRALRSAQRKRNWADPAYRAKHAAAMKRVMATPEYRAKLLAGVRKKFTDKEWVAQRAEKIRQSTGGQAIMYQLILKQAGVICPWFEPGKQIGDAIWVRTEEQARHLLEHNIAAWPVDAPREIQEDSAGAERKSFAAQTVGRLTDSRSLSASGLVTPLRV